MSFGHFASISSCRDRVEQCRSRGSTIQPSGSTGRVNCWLAGSWAVRMKNSYSLDFIQIGRIRRTRTYPLDLGWMIDPDTCERPQHSATSYGPYKLHCVTGTDPADNAYRCLDYLATRFGPCVGFRIYQPPSDMSNPLSPSINTDTVDDISCHVRLQNVASRLLA